VGTDRSWEALSAVMDFHWSKEEGGESNTHACKKNKKLVRTRPLKKVKQRQGSHRKLKGVN